MNLIGRKLLLQVHCILNNCFLNFFVIVKQFTENIVNIKETVFIYKTLINFAFICRSVNSDLCTIEYVNAHSQYVNDRIHLK